MKLSLLNATFLALALSRVAFADGDIPCLKEARSMIELVSCFDRYTVPEATYDSTSYAAAQPQGNEANVWSNTINNMLLTSCIPTPGSGPSEPVPVDGLNDFQVGGFGETDETGQPTGRYFCVLSERFYKSSGGQDYFKRGWGYVITVGQPQDAQRMLHFSAPHPSADEHTPLQAAVLFRNTWSKSFVTSGRHRAAYKADNTCIPAPTGADEPYYVTDASHNVLEPFHLAFAATRNWQQANGGCPSASCAYLQFHGKKEKQCENYNVFLASGRGNTNSSVHCHADATLPIRKLQTRLDDVYPAHKHGIPGPDAEGKCDLTATRNVQARLVGGVPVSNLCDANQVVSCTCTEAQPACLGPFVQLEQDEPSRLPAEFGNWVDVITAAFP